MTHAGTTHAEVLVAGAGPAGIAAAIAAAEHGRRVTVLDDNLSAGGQIWRGSTIAPKARAEERRQRLLDRFARSGATLLPGHRIFAASKAGTVEALWETGSSSSVQRFTFDQLILATGARERFLPFPGWTLPGVFGAGGLQALVKSGFPVAGKRVVVSGTGPLLLAVAAHLAEDGAVVSTLAEQATAAQLARFTASLWAQPAKLMQGAGYRAKLWQTAYRPNCWVTEALPNASRTALRAVRLTDGTRTWEEPCDLLACGFHLVPNTEVAALLGCAFAGGFVSVDASQRTSLPGIFCAGEPTGIAGLDAALLQGEIAGLSCAAANTTALRRQAAAERRFAERLTRAFALREELRSLARPETIVCRCEDVPLSRLTLHLGWTDAKLQTRCGMGPCQGRICGPAVEVLLGWKASSVRQPLFPVPLDALCAPNQVELIEEKV
jgi:NADPH-dependent 2,4-dienoyl-CoA reductase/sulfur reductase-like enzyme